MGSQVESWRGYDSCVVLVLLLCCSCVTLVLFIFYKRGNDMAIADFTEMVRLAELPAKEPVFEKKVRNDILPGFEVAVYQSLDSSDYYYATREACILIGFSANWLYTTLQRQSTINELKRLGVEIPLRQITARMGRIKKPVKVLTRSDFMGLIEYAKNVGNKDAVNLYRTFQILGLNKFAGIPSNPEEIGAIYNQISLTKD